MESAEGKRFSELIQIGPLAKWETRVARPNIPREPLKIEKPAELVTVARIRVPDAS